MSRHKGPATIRFLDAAKQDDVVMRRMLWRGGVLASLQAKLTGLFIKQLKLIQQRSDLGVRALPLLDLLKGQPTTLPEIKRERTAHAQLREIKMDFKRAEAALSDIEEQIKETQQQIDKVSRSRQRKAVFPWQEKAVQLIMLQKLLHTAGNVLSTQGAAITTDELQTQLRAEGFTVGGRELRRFMRRCQIAGQQGRRTDHLRLHVSQSDDSDKREVLSLQRLSGMSDAEWTLMLRESATPASAINRELREQRRAEQSAMTEAKRKQRISLGKTQ
jgi:hypothetical protein